MSKQLDYSKYLRIHFLTKRESINRVDIRRDPFIFSSFFISIRD